MNGIVRWTRVGALSIAALTVLSLPACRDDGVGPEGGLPSALEGLPVGIHPVLSIPGLGVASPPEITRVRLHLYEVGQDDKVASYQGVLRYDPEALEILEGSFADGLVGAWNVVEPGLLRFAGVAPSGMDGAPALDLTVRALRPPRAQDFRVELEELVGAEGFADLSANVGEGGEPIITGQALLPTLRR